MQQTSSTCPSDERIIKLKVNTDHWWNVNEETEAIVKKLSH